MKKLIQVEAGQGIIESAIILRAFIQDETGQSVIEYGGLLAFVAGLLMVLIINKSYFSGVFGTFTMLYFLLTHFITLMLTP